MAEAHRRKKEPERVRRQLLDVAARVVERHGIPAITLEAVASASGLSKGGLLHHFPTKMSLVDALFDDLLARFDADIEERMRADPIAGGRFSRAYLGAVADLRDRPSEARDWLQATLAMLAEPRLRQRWRDWVEACEERYVGTDLSPEARIVRLAADGLWMGETLQSSQLNEAERSVLLKKLGALTLV